MRYFHRAAVGIVVLLAGACGGRNERAQERAPMFVSARDSSWFAERAALLDELSRREAQWAALRPPAYRFRTTWTTMGSYYRGEVVAVAGRPLLVCDTTGLPANADTRT